MGIGRQGSGARAFILLIIDASSGRTYPFGTFQMSLDVLPDAGVKEEKCIHALTGNLVIVSP